MITWCHRRASKSSRRSSITRRVVKLL